MNGKAFLLPLARLLMSSLFVWDGIVQLRNPGGTARYFASGAHWVRPRGSRAGTDAERALSARRSSRHQRNALTGERARAPGRSCAGRSHWC